MGQRMATAVSRRPSGVSRARREKIVSLAIFAFLVMLAIFLGVALAAVATLFESSVAVYIAVPLAPLLALAVLAAPILAPLGVIATFPVGSTGAPIGAVTLQSAEAAVMVVALMLIVRRLAMGHTPLAWSSELYVPVALLGWMLVSLFSALDETLAIKQLIAVAGGLTFACVILASCRGMRDLRVFLGGFVLSTTVLAMTALSSREDFAGSSYGGSQVLRGRLQGAFEHPNQLGALCAMATPVAAGFALGGRTRRVRVVAAVMLGIVLAALALSLARGAWLGTAVAAVLMIATLPEARRKLLTFGVPVALAFALLWSVLPQNEPVQIVTERAEAFTTLSPYDDRDSIWREALREIKDEPWTGQGPGNFSVASSRAGSEASTVSAYHAHNLFLNWAAESGLPAAMLLVVFAIALAAATRTASRATRRRGDPGDRAIVIGIAGALLTTLAQGTVDYTLGNSVVHIALWGMIGALLVARRDAGLLPGRPRPR
jgi:putative inorganic carbon (hco3(-)) transporter